MKYAVYSICLIVLAGLAWCFPLFHIVPLADVAAARRAADFDAARFAADFWTMQLVPSFGQATDAHELCSALHNDPVGVWRRYGRPVGIGRNRVIFLRGEGTIVAVDSSGVAVSCIPPDDQADLVLKTGPLFGNTVRDATGQLSASEFANSQEFNAISRELNQIVEEQVLPVLSKGAHVGATIRFVACAEVRTHDTKIAPLRVLPLSVKFP